MFNHFEIGWKDGKLAYVLNKDLSIAVVDTATHQITTTFVPGTDLKH